MRKWIFISSCMMILSQFCLAGSKTETAQEALKNMKVGLNLNNSLDEHYKKGDRNDPSTFETQTGRPVTTAAIIQSWADAGFGVVRVPVTWYPHMDPQTGKVDEVWMNRVEEVVNYVLDAGMYCILNVHHDAGSKDTRWIIADMEEYPQISTRFVNLWKQIAGRFKKYDDRLLFEGYNEILDKRKSWSRARVDGAYEAANRLNQDFVKTVRATGGKNKTRNLVVSTYATSVMPKALDAFVLPDDKSAGHLIVQVHCYRPGEFTERDVNLAKQGKESRSDFRESDKEEIDVVFNNLNRHLLSKGYPCILGEFGAWNKNNEDDRARHAEYFVRKCCESGILPIYWYNPMYRYDRATCTWTFPKLRDALIDTANKYTK